jgi:hypothetical protein
MHVYIYIYTRTYIWQARCETYTQQLSSLQHQNVSLQTERGRERDRQTSAHMHDAGRDMYSQASNMRTPSNAQQQHPRDNPYTKDRDGADREASRAPVNAAAARSVRDGLSNAMQGRRSLGSYGADSTSGRVDGASGRNSLGGYGTDGSTGRSSPVAASTPVQPSYPAGSGAQSTSTPVQPPYSAPGNNGHAHNASTPVLHHAAGGTPLGQAHPHNSRPGWKDEGVRGREVSEGTPGKQTPDLAALVSVSAARWACRVCVCVRVCALYVHA